MTEEVYTAQGVVREDSIGGFAEGTKEDIKLSKRGEVVVCDWYTQMALEGRVYQIRAGSITTPLTGQEDITDAGADMACSARLGIAMIPVYLYYCIRNGVGAGNGTLYEAAAKSYAAIHTPTTAFVPLPLKIGGVASSCIAGVTTADGETVAAEVATATRQHWHSANPVAIGAGNDYTSMTWTPRVPPVCAGAACFYTQSGANTTGADFYAGFDFVELPTVSVA